MRAVQRRAYFLSGVCGWSEVHCGRLVDATDGLQTRMWLQGSESAYREPHESRKPQRHRVSAIAGLCTLSTNVSARKIGPRARGGSSWPQGSSEEMVSGNVRADLR